MYHVVAELKRTLGKLSSFFHSRDESTTVKLDWSLEFADRLPWDNGERIEQPKGIRGSCGSVGQITYMLTPNIFETEIELGQ